MKADFPSLTQDVMPDARLFATRDDLVASLAGPRFEQVAEIGVALAGFSTFLVDVLKPRRFVAFDVFRMHLWPEHWGQSSQEIFGEKTHREYYEARMAEKEVDLVVVEGESDSTLALWPDACFDLIYIDAQHDYDGVRRDTEQSARLLKRDGLLIFNDYIMFDPFLRQPYGVVPCVNELVMAGGWDVIGFGLQKDMFCDIAVRKR